MLIINNENVIFIYSFYFILIYISIYVCVCCICVYVYGMCACMLYLWGPSLEIRIDMESSGAVVKEVCEAPIVGAGNITGVILKNSKYS